jgi:RHS repeat-associated protein
MDGGSTLYWKEQELYGSSRLGLWEPNVQVGSDVSAIWDNQGLKRYELSNHLDNVLAVISDKSIQEGDHYKAELLSVHDYYPFGMLEPDRSYSLGTYRYGFNGKENDNEVKGEGNQQDYGMRVYDPRVGRFLSIDPLTEQYPWYTPYQFSGNTPIQATDLDGLEEYMKQVENGLRQHAQMKIDNDRLTKIRKTGSFQTTVPNWGEKWKNWNDSKPATHSWAIPSRFLYEVANDGKITYTTVTEGRNSARGVDNVGVSEDKAIVGAGLNTLANVILPVVGAEINAAKLRPQGVNAKDFDAMSKYLRSSVGEISNDIVVQGSRAAGTATAASDIDIAIKVTPEQFDELISKSFGKPNVNSAKWKTMQHAIKTGKITTGDAGLRNVKNGLKELLDMKVDVSIIKKGGLFDNGAQLPIKGATPIKTP